MTKDGPAGLFRGDLKIARVVAVGKKFGIEAEYMDGKKEILSQIFDSRNEAQQEILETLEQKKTNSST
ncbi:MAG TPA: hypothetical protein VMC43_00815 [Candidatus Paceibacterota bacterium]|nr:hypothetical protein [Candidatus Paceibacterota bacterium]